ncbi:MAG: SDR family NAD(P)-dependent oxidoreductase [Phycisphaerales bacterium]|nr:SDR family NAD(P)-dependent oxidoreductase [Phycisphaerales bacterium]
MGINDKVALVTGAGQGIGRAIALRLAADEASIAIVGVKEDASSRAPGGMPRQAAESSIFVVAAGNTARTSH